MKTPWRLCLMLLLAVLLPLRAVAVGMPCAGLAHLVVVGQVPAPPLQAGLLHAGAEHVGHHAAAHDHTAQNPAGHDHADAAAGAGGEHHAAPGAPDGPSSPGGQACSHCAACCAATPLIGHWPGLLPLPLVAQVPAPVPAVPRPRFESDGPDRPPRAA